MPHGRLLAKLHDFGIRGLVSKRIEDFLNDRKMFVRIRNGSPDQLRVISGVPQRSVLGPVLLYLLMT